MTSTKPVLKVVLCGEYGVGKSSLFRRFAYDTFLESSDRTSTLGFDHFEKSYCTSERDISLQLWDTGGLERIASMTSSYFKFAHAAVLVFSYDSLESFNVLSQHMLDILSYSDNTKIFLCGNKSDLNGEEEGPSEAMISAFLAEYRISDSENLIRKTYRTSCKTCEGVSEMFEDIATILSRSVRSEQPDPDLFQLRNPSISSSSSKSACCSGT